MRLDLFYICCSVVWISKFVIVVKTWHQRFSVAEQLLGCHSVVRECRVDNVQQKAGLLGSGETLHQRLFVRSFLEQAEVWSDGSSLGYKNVRTPCLILRGVDLAKGVPGVNLQGTIRRIPILVDR
jgi:hypothetical protein